MKKFQHLISKMVIIAGTIITTYNGLNFAQGNSVEIKYGLADKVAYFYTPETRLWITVGVTFLLIGILFRNKK